MRPVKASLPVTLLSSIVFLLLVTIAVVWISARQGLRSSVEAMAETQALEALSRVEEKTTAQLGEAKAASALTAEHLVGLERTLKRPLTYADMPQITSQLRAVMTVYPNLSFLSVSIAGHGEYAHVQRSGDELRAVEMTRPTGGIATQRYISYDGATRVVTRVDPRHRYVPQERPFYKAAARETRAVWTDSYFFLEPDGETYPGLSFAIPVYSGNRLAYVVTADFSSASLCRFLQDIKVGKTGYAFVVDDRNDGQKSLLAHPDPKVLLQKKGRKTEVVSLDQIHDSALRTLMMQIARNGAASSFTGKVKDSSGLGNSSAGSEYFASYKRVSGIPSPGLSMGIIVPLSELTGPLQTHERTITLVGIAALLLGLIFSWQIWSAVAKPLRSASTQLANVGNMQLDSPPVPTSGLAELDELAGSIETMKTRLRRFNCYLPTELVRRVLASDSHPVMGGEKRELTIQCCEIAGFTRIVKELPTQESLQLLQVCLGELSEEIIISGGTMDRFAGEQIIAFWGAPESVADHAAHACRTALRNCERMKRMRVQWQERGLPAIYIHLGLHTGETLVGNIGNEHCFNYSIIGEAVNLTGHLKNLNRVYGTEILISQATRMAAGDSLVARPVDWVSLTEDEEACLIFEPFGFRDEMDDADYRRAREIVKLSERILIHLRAQQWNDAHSCLNEVLVLAPLDPVAQHLKQRCDQQFGAKIETQK